MHYSPVLLMVSKLCIFATFVDKNKSSLNSPRYVTSVDPKHINNTFIFIFSYINCEKQVSLCS